MGTGAGLLVTGTSSTANFLDVLFSACPVQIIDIGGILQISDSTFQSSLTFSCLSVTNSDLSLFNTNFEDCHTLSSGGGLYLSAVSQKSISLEKVSFESCTAAMGSGGGAHSDKLSSSTSSSSSPSVWTCSSCKLTGTNDFAFYEEEGGWFCRHCHIPYDPMMRIEPTCDNPDNSVGMQPSRTFLENSTKRRVKRVTGDSTASKAAKIQRISRPLSNRRLKSRGET